MIKMKDYFASKDSPFDAHDLTIYDAVKRPRILLSEIIDLMDLDLRSDLIYQTEVEIKYEGYSQSSERS